MTTGAHVVLGERSRLGAWRAAAALPAIIASMLLLLFLLGGTGDWDGLILLGWLTVGLLTLTRRGEWLALRLGYRFRRPSAAEQATLGPVWCQVLTRCGIDAGGVRLYVRPSHVVNAYAVGGRSIAVTSRLVREHQAGGIDAEALAGILCHETGHLVTNDARFGPAVTWLSLPWRLASRLVLRTASRLAGRQPRSLLAILCVVVFAVAIVQSVQQHRWGVVVVLSALAVFSIVTPLTDAALSRAGERAADRYAARAGYAEPLSRALRGLGDGQQRRSLSTAILASHPRPEHRVRDLGRPNSDRSAGHASVVA